MKELVRRYCNDCYQFRELHPDDEYYVEILTEVGLEYVVKDGDRVYLCDLDDEILGVGLEEDEAFRYCRKGQEQNEEESP